MKKLILAAMLLAAPAFGQRSISTSTNGMSGPVGSWGIQSAPTNLVWTGFHENRARNTNTPAGSHVFQGGFTVSTVATQAAARVTSWAVIPTLTNSTAARFEGGFNVVGIATNGNSWVPGWSHTTGNSTNAGPALFQSTLTVDGNVQMESDLTVDGQVLFTSSATIDGNVQFGATLSFPDNIRQTFNPGVDAAGINVGSLAGDIGTPVNGDLVYNSSLGALRARIAGAWVSLGAGGGGGGDDKIATNTGTGYFSSFLNPTNLGRATFNASIASFATNLSHATHNEFVLDGPRLGRLSMTGNMIIGVVHPTSATQVGIEGKLRIIVTAGSITWSNITARGPVAVNVGTNEFYIKWDGTNCYVDAGQLPTSGSGDHFALTNAPILNSPTIIGSPTIAGYVANTRTLTVGGTANEVDVSGGTLDLSANRSWTASLSSTIDLGGKTSFELPNAAAPTTDAFGELAGDNNAWAASRGALQFFDGTANTYLIGVLASDLPGDQQTLKFNTASGTITWEPDADSGGSTAINDIGDATGNGTVALGTTQQAWTSTLDDGDILIIDQTDADRTDRTKMLHLRDADIDDPHAVYISMSSDSDGTPTVDYEFSQTLFFSRIGQTNASTFLNSGPAGFGSTVSIAGAATLSGGGTSTTPSANDNDTSIATTAFVQGEIAEANKGQFGITIDGGGAAITTGTYYVRVPWSGTITGWDIVADQSGSCVVDIWKDTYANFPPDNSDSIAGSELPTLSSAVKNQDASLSTWTTTVTAGDYVGFNVDSATTVTRVHIAIYGTKN